MSGHDDKALAALLEDLQGQKKKDAGPAFVVLRSNSVVLALEEGVALAERHVPKFDRKSFSVRTCKGDAPCVQVQNAHAANLVAKILFEEGRWV